MANSVSLDLRVFSVQQNKQASLNIFANRAGFVREQGLIEQNEYVLPPASTYTLPNLNNILTTVIYSLYPINITGVAANNLHPTTFYNQTMFVVQGNFTNCTIVNGSTKESPIRIIRYAESQVNHRQEVIPRQLITFARLERISELPLNVFNYLNFKVQSVTLQDWSNDQITNPGISTLTKNKYRICNQDGSPNLNGKYIMILNDHVSQENHSGTLQLWVEETE